MQADGQYRVEDRLGLQRLSNLNSSRMQGDLVKGPLKASEQFLMNPRDCADKYARHAKQSVSPKMCKDLL